MSNEQSIRDELFQIWEEYGTSIESDSSEGHEMVDAILASPVIRRIQAEALREAAKSGQAKMFTPAVYVGPERLRLAISTEKWLLEEADRIERGETA